MLGNEAYIIGIFAKKCKWRAPACIRVLSHELNGSVTSRPVRMANRSLSLGIIACCLSI